MNLIEEFIEKYLDEETKKAESVENIRSKFVADYPYERIALLSKEEYMMAPVEDGREKTFCQKLKYELDDMGHLGNTYPDIFGIYLKNGMKISLSKTFEKKFGNDYDSAFKYIITAILQLLEAAGRDDYNAIASCELNSSFKMRLLMVYFPEKIVPVCTRKTMKEYCERVGIIPDPKVDVIYWNIALRKWKESVSEISDWSNFILMRFCDRVWRANKSIDGDALTRDTNAKKAELIETEIADLNLKGEMRMALVQVRVNQGVFRERLLQKYDRCCLCCVQNTNLLVASHIKPWSESTSEEKLDIDNGFLMCPNHDRLFDKGLISFTDEGQIMISDELEAVDRICMNVKDSMKITLSARNKKFLKYHRDNIFNSRNKDR